MPDRNVSFGNNVFQVRLDDDEQRRFAAIKAHYRDKSTAAVLRRGLALLWVTLPDAVRDSVENSELDP